MGDATPPELDYAAHVERLRRLDPALADEAARFTGVSGVMAWMRRGGRTRAPVDIVGQDEFHYDFMIELEPAGRWLVFGVT